MRREALNIHSFAIIVSASGGSGMLEEFLIAYDEGRLIDVLTNTGGITGQVESLVRLCQKDTGAVVLYDDDPVGLLNRLIDSIR